jgi:hypothetical protein
MQHAERRERCAVRQTRRPQMTRMVTISGARALPIGRPIARPSYGPCRFSHRLRRDLRFAGLRSGAWRSRSYPGGTSSVVTRACMPLLLLPLATKGGLTLSTARMMPLFHGTMQPHRICLPRTLVKSPTMLRTSYSPRPAKRYATWIMRSAPTCASVRHVGKNNRGTESVRPRPRPERDRP